MTGRGKNVFFVLNLVQDVNIVRELVYLTARETEAQIGFLVSEGFLKRDRQKIWQREIAILASAVGATMHLYGSAADAFSILEGGAGMIFCASESNLTAHRETSGVFEVAPATYLRVTLQHGFECVGFLQSREHVMSHGRNISFSADVVCGWFALDSLTSLTASQRAKLYVTGPPTLLRKQAATRDAAQAGGLICENLHSVRLRASGDHKSSFVETFLDFCTEMGRRSEKVTLRPHPGGQYVLKNKVSLPDNVQLESRPLFEVDLAAFRFGISAPSTIVFDMVLAGIPVGLWRDPGGVMDASNYDGLTEISTLEDWLGFERDVEVRPQMIIDRQEAFLRRLDMPIDPQEVYRRFARLIVAGLAGLTKDLNHSRKFAGASGPEATAGRKRPIVLSQDMLVEEDA